MKKLNILFAATAALLTASIAHAEPMQVSTPVGYNALDADGVFMSNFPANTFSFSIGGFAGGFTPTPENAADWASNWVTVRDTVWRVSGPPAAINRVNLSFNQDVAAAAGLSGYVWGYDQIADLASAQWILIENSNWTFPAFNELGVDLQPQNTWSIGSAGSNAIWGTVSDSGMQLQAVPEPSTYALIFGLGILGFLGFRRARK